MGAAILLLSGAFLLLWRQQARRLQALEGQLAQRQALVAAAQQKAAARPALEAAYAQLLSAVAGMERGLPPAEARATLLPQLSHLAQAVGATIGGLEPLPEQPKSPAVSSTQGGAGGRSSPGQSSEGSTTAPQSSSTSSRKVSETSKTFDEYAFRATLLGTYPEVIAFLAGLERFPKAVQVKAVELRAGVAKEFGELEAILTCTVYTPLLEESHEQAAKTNLGSGHRFAFPRIPGSRTVERVQEAHEASAHVLSEELDQH